MLHKQISSPRLTSQWPHFWNHYFDHAMQSCMLVCQFPVFLYQSHCALWASNVPFGLLMCPLWSGLKAKCSLCHPIGIEYLTKQLKAPLHKVSQWYESHYVPLQISGEPLHNPWLALYPVPRPAFCRLQYGKAGRAWLPGLSSREWHQG